MQFIIWLLLTLFFIGLSTICGYRTKEEWDKLRKKHVENVKKSQMFDVEIAQTEIKNSNVTGDVVGRDKFVFQTISVAGAENAQSQIASKEYLEEKSFDQVVKILNQKNQTSTQNSITRFNTLYAGHWIPKDGWNGEVYSLPEKLDPPELADKFGWKISIKEKSSGWMVIVYTNQNISRFRPNQLVKFWGRLQHFSIGLLIDNGEIEINK